MHEVPAAGSNGNPPSVRFPAPQEPDIGRHVPICQLIPHTAGVPAGGFVVWGVTEAGDPPVKPGVLEGDGPPGVLEGDGPPGVLEGDGPPGEREGHLLPKAGQKTLPKYNPRTIDTITTTHATTMPRTTKGSILNYPKFFLKTRGI